MIILILTILISYFFYKKYNRKKFALGILIGGLSFLISVSFLINRDKNVSYEMVSIKESTYIITDIKYDGDNLKTLITEDGIEIEVNENNYFSDEEDYWSSDVTKLARVKEIIQNYEVKNKLIHLFFLAPKEKNINLYTISYNSAN